MSLAARLGLVLTTAVVVCACEKEQPPATDPGHGEDPVVVEDPGATPEQPPPEQPAPEQPSEGRTEIIPTEVSCQTDADCVKDSCCHARSCMAASSAPDCSSVMCTADCQAGTMDCNGGCLCQDGKCAARLWWPPEA